MQLMPVGSAQVPIYRNLRQLLASRLRSLWKDLRKIRDLLNSISCGEELQKLTGLARPYGLFGLGFGLEVR